jgi:hypothetical protein
MFGHDRNDRPVTLLACSARLVTPGNVSLNLLVPRLGLAATGGSPPSGGVARESLGDGLPHLLASVALCDALLILT